MSRVVVYSPHAFIFKTTKDISFAKDLQASCYEENTFGKEGRSEQAEGVIIIYTKKKEARLERVVFSLIKNIHEIGIDGSLVEIVKILALIVKICRKSNSNIAPVPWFEDIVIVVFRI